MASSLAKGLTESKRDIGLKKNYNRVKLHAVPSRCTSEIQKIVHNFVLWNDNKVVWGGRGIKKRKKKKEKQTRKGTNPLDFYSANFCKSSKAEKCCSVLVAGLPGGEGREGDVEKKVLGGGGCSRPEGKK